MPKIDDNGLNDSDGVANDSKRLCEKCQCVGSVRGGVMTRKLVRMGEESYLDFRVMGMFLSRSRCLLGVLFLFDSAVILGAF